MGRDVTEQATTPKSCSGISGGKEYVMTANVHATLCKRLLTVWLVLSDHLRLQTGTHFLVPAFFELLVHLQRERRDFAIIFRTFGKLQSHEFTIVSLE